VSVPGIKVVLQDLLGETYPGEARRVALERALQDLWLRARNQAIDECVQKCHEIAGRSERPDFIAGCHSCAYAVRYLKGEGGAGQ
jgi:hypothetical protein